MQGGRLIVSVVENPVINRIAFEGNRKVKDEQLKAEIQSKERGTLSRPIVQADVLRMVDVYRRGGRFDVTRRSEDHRVGRTIASIWSLRFPKAARPASSRIEFVGNKFYSDYRLQDVIKTSQTNLLSFLQTSDIYDPDRIEADRELLRRFYLKHGFIDVRIISAVRRIRSCAQTGSSSPSRSKKASNISVGVGRRAIERALDQSGAAAAEAARLCGRRLQRRGWSRSPSRT